MAMEMSKVTSRYKSLREGQSVMVQATREGVGQKGPRATMNITLASRYLVLMPRQEQFSLSKKISNEQESDAYAICCLKCPDHQDLV